MKNAPGDSLSLVISAHMLIHLGLSFQAVKEYIVLEKCFRDGFSPIKKTNIISTALKLCDLTDDGMT